MRTIWGFCGAGALALTLSGCGEEQKEAALPDVQRVSIDHTAEVAALQGDVAIGERLIRTCRSCHQLDKPRNATGPHLVGLFGRQAGAAEGYRYSEALRQSGLIWSVETLQTFLASPKRTVPGTKMKYPGVKPAEMPHIIAYLYEKSGEMPAE